jgi:50S ribosomal protein L16 3-hydroxylase
MLQNFDKKTFLRDYWQKKPLLIRGGLKNWQCPIDPDDLAGLACEESIESRIVIEHPTNKWNLEKGPFSEERFDTVPKNKWTLLVQAVDHYVPDIQSLLDSFDFLPRWRIDDIMISYAAKGGSVGPHYDQYDVFLIQGAGKRRWKIGPICSEDDKLQDNNQLRLLKNFTETDEWIVEPGDIVYIPPRFGHWGIAEDDQCITLSVGFRAPSQSQILGNFCDEVLSQLSEDHRYSDSDIKEAPKHIAEIDIASLQRVQKLIAEALEKPALLAQSFGELVTTPKYIDEEFERYDLKPTAIKKRINNGEQLLWHPAARYAFHCVGDDNYLLFVNGETRQFGNELIDFVKQLCSAAVLNESAQHKIIADKHAMQLTTELLAGGVLAFDSDLYKELDDDHHVHTDDCDHDHD